MLIRLACESDARDIAKIHVASWKATYRGILSKEGLDSLSEDDKEAAWRPRLKLCDWTTLVGQRDSRIVGFVTCRPCPDKDKDSTIVAELMAIYLLPEYWGQGLGRALMNEALERMLAQGFSEVALWVLEGNSRACRFYECAGFTFDGNKSPDVIRDSNVIKMRYVKKL